MSTVILFRLDEYSGQAISAELWSKPLVGAPAVAYSGTTAESEVESGLFFLTITATVAAGFYAIRAKLGASAIAYDSAVYCDGTADSFMELNYHNRLDASVSSRLASADYVAPLDAAETTAASASALIAYDPPTRAEATADKAEILTRGNAAWITATGFSTLTAAQVWTYSAAATLIARVAAIFVKLPTSPYLAGSANADGTFAVDVNVPDVKVDSFSTAAIQQLASTRQININVPTLLGRTLTDPLVRGDSYTTALASAIEFSRADFVDIPDGSTASLQATMLDCSDPITFVIEGDEASIPVPTGTKVVRFEPTSNQTAEWQPGKYEFCVVITFPSGEVRTFVGPRTYLWVV